MRKLSPAAQGNPACGVIDSSLSLPPLRKSHKKTVFFCGSPSRGGGLPMARRKGCSRKLTLPRFLSAGAPRGLTFYRARIHSFPISTSMCKLSPAAERCDFPCGEIGSSKGFPLGGSCPEGTDEGERTGIVSLLDPSSVRLVPRLAPSPEGEGIIDFSQSFRHNARLTPRGKALVTPLPRRFREYPGAFFW